MNAIQLRVSKESAGLRLDRFLAQAAPRFSRARLQSLIREGFVTLNATKTRPRQIVRGGDLIRLTEPAPKKIAARPEKIALEVLFEDADLLVINKPPGMVVHAGAGNAEHTLVNALLAHCRTLSGIGGKERPGIVHRLDKDTSGCLVVAKNDVAHQDLARQFAERTIEKIYLALVSGALRVRQGVIDAAIGRHPVHRQRMSVATKRGRAARTDYRVLQSGGGVSLVECTLHSGRTHQIRVHLHHLGHPVLGDKVYGPKMSQDYPRQMLHSWKLGFRHPRDGKWRRFEAPLPSDFANALKRAGLAI
jgi:23S rRNA pseudouridine1911/1915/1917 synthase